MHYSEDLPKSAEMLRMVIPRLASLDLPVTPLNYALWYEYFLGNNEQLNKQMDELLEKEGGWCQEEAEGLFRTYVLGESSQRYDNINKDVQSLLARVMTLVSDAGGDVEEFGSSLKNASESLSSTDGHVSELGQLVTSLIDSTEQMVTSNQTVQEQLVTSTQEVERLKKDLEAVKREAMLDPLTGIANRKVLDQNLLLTLQQVKEGMSACVIMLDVDKFKLLNDRFGHLVGDKVLKFLAQTLTEAVKGKDCVARYGGEEFCIILRDITPEGALSVAEALRQTVEKADLKRSETGESLGRVTISLGVTCVRGGDSTEDIIERADAALYTSKNQGRNRVTASPALAG